MAIDDLRLERWQKDRDIFVSKAKSLGADVFVQSANGNEETQMAQIHNILADQDLDVEEIASLFASFPSLTQQVLFHQ